MPLTIFTARPGVVIGRKGSEIDKLKEELSKLTGKEVYVDIQEVKQAETMPSSSLKALPCSSSVGFPSDGR